jgi:hypothetical protein
MYIEAAKSSAIREPFKGIASRIQEMCKRVCLQPILHITCIKQRYAHVGNLNQRGSSSLESEALLAYSY